ncbi:MAG: SemiSWEET transporter [Burkholderiaceae bacterium]
MITFVDLLGYIGATLTTVAFLPQVILTWRSNDLSGVSLPMYLIFVVGVVFWLAFGILADIMPTIVANAVTLLLAGSVLVLKLRDLRRRTQKSRGYPTGGGGLNREPSAND